MAEQNGPQARPPSGQYPSPHSYPSPQMQPSYAYPPPQGQSNEPYRQSPSASNAPLPPINLAPLRSIDGQPQGQPPPHGGPHQSGSPLPQSVQPMSAYYPPPPQGMPHPGQGITSSPHMMRYAPIPQGDARMMTGGRHKKEIKRRTKTGCLTCRKRRIKCDEQHPVCRNCQKSKRECLGYDPIFKQQTGPQQLQPAPSASPSSTSSTPAAGSSAPQAYSSSQSNYTPPMSGAYSTPSAAAAPPHPSHSNQPSYEYNSAIDPALAGADAGPPPSAPLPAYGASPGIDARKSSLSGGSAHSAPGVKMERLPARLLQVDELFFIGHSRPTEMPPNPEPLTEAKMDEIKTLYINDYAPGLDSILETTWYPTLGVEKLLANARLCQQMAELIRFFAQLTSTSNYEVESQCRAMETKVVWQLLSLCRPSSAMTTNGTNGTMNVDLDEANKRLDVLEALITNRIMNSNRISEINYPGDLPLEKIQEIDFWKALGKFVTLRSEDPSARPELDIALTQCRNLLSGRENRDVIYSIMVARHVGARVPEFPDHVFPVPGLSEENDHNKLYIAKTFIGEQASFKGTNHPIQRLCDMVLRSWQIR